jgi:hypothetical protein
MRRGQIVSNLKLQSVDAHVVSVRKTGVFVEYMRPYRIEEFKTGEIKEVTIKIRQYWKNDDLILVAP